MKIIFGCLFFLSLLGCTGAPKNVTPVSNFQLHRYLGTWHEIARLDHSFERGLDKVTAEYSLREGGGVSVKNTGFLTAKLEKKEAVGKAFFVGPETEGHLKVSFFGPFYGAYIIFHLDQVNYQYAFVSGPDLDYLWLLSRTPEVSAEVKAEFMAKSQALGFDTSKLIWVNQK